MDNVFKCCICKKMFSGWGNNPYPIKKNEEARCCDECNSKYVIPVRINRMKKGRK